MGRFFIINSPLFAQQVYSCNSCLKYSIPHSGSRKQEEICKITVNRGEEFRVDKQRYLWYNYLALEAYPYRGVEQLEARRISNPEGSEGSAAGGGESDLSEWPRSADEEGVRADEDAGHRNRA